MKAEIRADGVHISGYVNVPGRESRPVLTPRGKVIEVIEQRAFQRAIDKAERIDLMLDHERIIASTKEGTFKAYEDEVGLRAEAIINDEEVIKGAREGKLKGWSFKMTKVKDEFKERAGKLPLRTVKEFDMPEITLALHKQPVYSSMSIELRAGEDEKPLVLAIDFDGTLCENRWPEIGNPIINTIEYLKSERNRGSKLILWTCRSNDQLNKAVEWCKEQGLDFDAVNDNTPESIEKYGGNSRKIWADYYIDDKNILIGALESRATEKTEIRATDENLEVIDLVEKKKEMIDYSKFENKIQEMKDKLFQNNKVIENNLNSFQNRINILK